jgi:hypothetical protein
MKFYSVNEAAKIFSMSGPTMLKAVVDGKIQTARLPSGQARISHEALVAFAEAHGYTHVVPIVEPLVSAQGRTEDIVKDVRLLLRILKNRPDFDPRSIADALS